MENVHNPTAKLLVAARKLCKKCARACVLVVGRQGIKLKKYRAAAEVVDIVDDRPTCFTHVLPSFCTEVSLVSLRIIKLSIKSLTDFVNLLTNYYIKFLSLLDFFDRMNSGSMVFATKFIGDLRKT